MVAPPELINTLIIVSNHTKVFIPAGQKAAKHILSIISILILVDKNISEFSLVILPDFFKILKKFDRFENYIIKIQSAAFKKALLIFCIYLCDSTLVIVISTPGSIFFRTDKTIFCLGYLGYYTPHLKALIVITQILYNGV